MHNRSLHLGHPIHSQERPQRAEVSRQAALESFEFHVALVEDSRVVAVETAWLLNLPAQRILFANVFEKQSMASSELMRVIC